MADAVAVTAPNLVEKLVPGQTQAETAAMVGRGSLVFLGGMAVAAVSFLFERAVMRTMRKL